MKKELLTGLVAIVVGCASPEPRNPFGHQEPALVHAAPEQDVVPKLNPYEFPPIDIFRYKESDSSYEALKRLYVTTKRFQIAVQCARLAGQEEPPFSLYRQLHDLHDDIKDHLKRAYCVRNNLVIKIDPKYEPAVMRTLDASARSRPIGIADLNLYNRRDVFTFADQAYEYYDQRRKADLPTPNWLIDRCPILSDLFVSRGYWQEQ